MYLTAGILKYSSPTESTGMPKKVCPWREVDRMRRKQDTPLPPEVDLVPVPTLNHLEEALGEGMRLLHGAAELNTCHMTADPRVSRVIILVL